MTTENSKYNLEDRLVKFACMCLDVCDLLPSSKAGQNLEHQLSRSGTAPALLYGEAQAAESRNDFIHKMKIALKELRESRVNLRIIKEKPIASHEKIDITFKEVNELVVIFTTSIETAKKNQLK
jgi:four helix bundle protein